MVSAVFTPKANNMTGPDMMKNGRVSHFSSHNQPTMFTSHGDTPLDTANQSLWGSTSNTTPHFLQQSGSSGAATNAPSETYPHYASNQYLPSPSSHSCLPQPTITGSMYEMKPLFGDLHSGPAETTFPPNSILHQDSTPSLDFWTSPVPSHTSSAHYLGASFPDTTRAGSSSSNPTPSSILNSFPLDDPSSSLLKGFLNLGISPASELTNFDHQQHGASNEQFSYGISLPCTTSSGASSSPQSAGDASSSGDSQNVTPRGGYDAPWFAKMQPPQLHVTDTAADVSAKAVGPSAPSSQPASSHPAPPKAITPSSSLYRQHHRVPKMRIVNTNMPTEITKPSSSMEVDMSRHGDDRRQELAHTKPTTDFLPMTSTSAVTATSVSEKASSSASPKQVPSTELKHDATTGPLHHIPIVDQTGHDHMNQQAHPGPSFLMSAASNPNQLLSHPPLDTQPYQHSQQHPPHHSQQQFLSHPYQDHVDYLSHTAAALNVTTLAPPTMCGPIDSNGNADVSIRNLESYQVQLYDHMLLLKHKIALTQGNAPDLITLLRLKDAVEQQYSRVVELATLLKHKSSQSQSNPILSHPQHAQPTNTLQQHSGLNSVGVPPPPPPPHLSGRGMSHFPPQQINGLQSTSNQYQGEGYQLTTQQHPHAFNHVSTGSTGFPPATAAQPAPPQLQYPMTMPPGQNQQQAYYFQQQHQHTDMYRNATPQQYNHMPAHHGHNPSNFAGHLGNGHDYSYPPRDTHLPPHLMFKHPHHDNYSHFSHTHGYGQNSYGMMGTPLANPRRSRNGDDRKQQTAEEKQKHYKRRQLLKEKKKQIQEQQEQQQQSSLSHRP